MVTETTPGPAKIAGVEVRSIDYVPLNERHGKVWSQGPLWFMSNAQIATLRWARSRPSPAATSSGR